MNIFNFSKQLTTVLVAATLVAGCSSTKGPEGSKEVREKLTRLQTDPQLSSRAPVAMQAAEEAVRAAEKPRDDKALSKHLVYIADRKVDIAAGLAQTRWEEDQLDKLSDQSAEERLSARTLEADMARQKVSEMQQQLAELNAKTTDRGVIITLGDVLFDTGKATLKGNATAHLAKLSTFLNQYPDRTMVIEGHTDNVGSEDYNIGLSHRRADAVKSYLINQGIDASRMSTSGRGESSPVSSNDTASGRQMNRRVEVIINNPPAQR